MSVTKFRGCLLGALLGDCLGLRFESAEIPVPVSSARVTKFFNELREKWEENNIVKELQYSDDTAMTKVLATSLINHKEVSLKNLAKEFTREYYNDKKERGYGIHVVHVFHKLKTQTVDVLAPAKAQFNGTGSYGNGASMRVSPIALFYKADIDKMVKAAADQSLVTHAHAGGYTGAVLQCLAVYLALQADPTSPLDPLEFMKNLTSLASKYEGVMHFFRDKLKSMEEMLSRPALPGVQEVVSKLGNDVTAIRSVPISIFAFLAGNKPIEAIQTSNQFERTVHYAITLGGDTDTIGSMAGAICGAFLGSDSIPEYLSKPCEGREEMIRLADELFNATEIKTAV